MFKKYNKPTIYEEVEKDKERETVSCYKCRCLLFKDEAVTVEYETICSSKLYYCHVCKPPYTRFSINFHNGKNYYKELEVDEQGEPVGYKKIKTE